MLACFSNIISLVDQLLTVDQGAYSIELYGSVNCRFLNMSIL